MKAHTSTCACFSAVETSCGHHLTVFPRFPCFLHAGLPSHPQHEVMKRQCTGCPGMITFYIKGKLEHATTFLSNLKVIWQYIFICSGVLGFVFCKRCEAGRALTKCFYSQTERTGEGTNTSVPQLQGCFSKALKSYLQAFPGGSFWRYNLSS